MTSLENTFYGWAAEGRTVRKGEKARSYMADPNYPQAPGIGLFAIDQTEERGFAAAPAGWVRLTAEEYAQRRQETKDEPARPVVKLTWDPDHKVMRIWCGRDKEAIHRLKAGGWVFDLASHRWRKEDVDPVEIAQKFTRLGYRVDALGFPYPEAI